MAHVTNPKSFRHVSVRMYHSSQLCFCRSAVSHITRVRPEVPHLHSMTTKAVKLWIDNDAGGLFVRMSGCIPDGMLCRHIMHMTHRTVRQAHIGCATQAWTMRKVHLCFTYSLYTSPWTGMTCNHGRGLSQRGRDEAELFPSESCHVWESEAVNIMQVFCWHLRHPRRKCWASPV